MLNGIKNKIEKSLRDYIRNSGNFRVLAVLSPFLAREIKDFVLRPAKRIRPLLFILGYLAFTGKKAGGLFKSALSFELLHDFMLIHDDIIDKSSTRRGKPSMHKMLDKHLLAKPKLKFTGQDLGIVVGDIIYALAIEAFLSVKEEPRRKEKALKRFIDSAFYTGCGEFIELIAGFKSLDEITKNDIYKIYDLKTAYYTFAYPLSIGAILAGAKDSQVDKIFRYGLYLGRAFQIKDDILGIFGDENKIGKSTLTDLQEAKRTLLIWHAYRHTDRQNKSLIREILAKEKVNKTDLAEIREILVVSGSLVHARQEISRCLKKAQELNSSCAMKRKYRDCLSSYCRKILEPD